MDVDEIKKDFCIHVYSRHIQNKNTRQKGYLCNRLKKSDEAKLAYLS